MFLSRYKWIVLCIVILLILAPFALMKAGLLPTINLLTKNPAPTPVMEKLCIPFPIVKGEISCSDAVKRASSDTKGKIKNVAVGTLSTDPKMLEVFRKKMWLIDIDLEEAITASSGAVVKSLRIGIPVDGDKSIFRTLIKP